MGRRYDDDDDDDNVRSSAETSSAADKAVDKKARLLKAPPCREKPTSRQCREPPLREDSIKLVGAFMVWIEYSGV